MRKAQNTFLQQIQTIRVNAVAEVTHNAGFSCLPPSADPSVQLCCWTEVCKQPLGNWKGSKRHKKKLYFIICRGLLQIKTAAESSFYLNPLVVMSQRGRTVVSHPSPSL